MVSMVVPLVFLLAVIVGVGFFAFVMSTSTQRAQVILLRTTGGGRTKRTTSCFLFAKFARERDAEKGTSGLLTLTIFSTNRQGSFVAFSVKDH